MGPLILLSRLWKMGAYDYITKSGDIGELCFYREKALEARELRKEVVGLEKEA